MPSWRVQGQLLTFTLHIPLSAVICVNSLRSGVIALLITFTFIILNDRHKRQDSPISVVTRLRAGRPRDRCSISDPGNRILYSFTVRPSGDRPILLSSEYRGFFRGKTARTWNNFHVCPVPKLVMQVHFVYHKFHIIRPVTGPKTLHLETGDCLVLSRLMLCYWPIHYYC